MTLRVAFVHPDLGIGNSLVGGAERLVVDAAKSLQDRGHEVIIYTSHHDVEHCFEETKGELKVEVHGDFLPRQFMGMFHLFFAAIRSIYLALWIYFWCPFHYDVIFVDQISYSIPILKHCAHQSVFYCHFPDRFLAPRSKSLVRKLAYRHWFDSWEAATIVLADKIFVNSRFTAKMFEKAFPNCRKRPEILYPGVSAIKFAGPFSFPAVERSLQSYKIITSLNRFERKKNIGLAIESFQWVVRHVDKALGRKLRLFIAGGYDARVRENVDYLNELKNMCHDRDLASTTIWPKDQENECFDIGNATVIFVPSISENSRNYLLQNSECVVYTPENEHFGIAPIEAMICGTPVVAINSGGPCETIIDSKTGYLCSSDAREMGARVKQLLNGEVDASLMGAAAREHALDSFSSSYFGDRLERYLL